MGRFCVSYFIRLSVVLAVLSGLVSACVSRPQESAQYRDITPQEAVLPEFAQTATGMPDNHVNNDGQLDILALSSGGSYGAYGAGVLNGWSERGTRPQFDVVTGVSTGALMSVFAFLGPRYDNLLHELYVGVRDDDVFTKRGLNGLLGDSLYDNTPLKRNIEKYVTLELLREIAIEHQKGRRLYVATTNLDAGSLIIWDMGKIAMGGRTNPTQHFQKVLRASSAVPAFFPPVYIKPQRGVQLRQAHVDGGVKSPLLIPNHIFLSRAKEKRIYVIVNDSIARRDSAEAVDGSLAEIARKTIATLSKELLIQNVYRGYVRAVNSNTKFHLTSVPNQLGLNPQSLSFDPKLLQGLYNAGRKTALGNNPWRRNPVGLGRYDSSLAAK